MPVIYVMSDIHGQMRRFESVLGQIGLQKEDTLYVLGDVIDRNPEGIAILLRLMAMENVKMLLGNHELMMLKALYEPVPEGEEAAAYYERKLQHWYRNGGAVTHAHLNRLPEAERQRIFRYLEELPLNARVEVRGRVYLLVHGAPACLYSETDSHYRNVRDFAVWKRYASFPPVEGVTVIFGHTPTWSYSHESPMSVWKRGRWMGIDCGCMLPEQGDPETGVRGRLACVRLEDEKTFYSEEVCF